MDDIQISLKAARVNAGLTQPDVAKNLHVTVQTLVNWELGRSEPSISQGQELSELYGIPLKNIFFKSEIK